MTQCKEGAQKEGLMLDTHEELYKWFTSQVIRNLHVVFTMNPSSEGLKDRAATSPALFNRCERTSGPTSLQQNMLMMFFFGLTVDNFTCQMRAELVRRLVH